MLKCLVSCPVFSSFEAKSFVFTSICLCDAGCVLSLITVITVSFFVQINLLECSELVELFCRHIWVLGAAPKPLYWHGPTSHRTSPSASNAKRGTDSLFKVSWPSAGFILGLPTPTMTPSQLCYPRLSDIFEWFFFQFIEWFKDIIFGWDVFYNTGKLKRPLELMSWHHHS